MLRLAPLGRFALVDEPLVQQRFSANSITRDFARSERARAAIVEKHRELFGRDPSILARHYYFLAGGQRLLGNLAGARCRPGPGPGAAADEPALLGDVGQSAAAQSAPGRQAHRAGMSLARPPLPAASFPPPAP